jgi:DNA invertase Pin-like site-specific DNA recombinase
VGMCAPSKHLQEAKLTGHDYLRSLGVELVPTSAPDFFTTDTPTAVLVRQVLGAISQFEKASLVAKLRAARERKGAAGGRGSGRFTYAQKVPEVVALVRELHGQRQSLRQISKTLAAQGHLTGGGKLTRRRRSGRCFAADRHASRRGPFPAVR